MLGISSPTALNVLEQAPTSLPTETASGRLLASPVSQTIAPTNLHLPLTQKHTVTLTSNTSQNCQ